MRRLMIAFALLAAVAAVAACAASTAPGWTYAPAPPATPIPSGSASGSPAASPSAAPSATATTAPSPSPSAAASPSARASAGPSPSAGASGGAGATLTVTAGVDVLTVGFDPKKLETAAKAPFTLVFDNQDPAALHNLVLKDSGGTAVDVTGDTGFFTGPGERTYQVPGLAAGDYQYLCEVHPSLMTGTLTVK